jgi:hypothetical protein
MRKGVGAVIITDANGRQVFGLTSVMSRELEKRGTPAQFQGFTVRVNADPPPGWWVDLPGYLAFAWVHNRVRQLRNDIRHRRYMRAYRQMRANLSDEETTNPGTSIPEDD